MLGASFPGVGGLSKDNIRFGRQGKRRRIEQGLQQEDDCDDTRSDGGFTEDGSFGNDLCISDAKAVIDIDEDFAHFFGTIADGEVDCFCFPIKYFNSLTCHVLISRHRLFFMLLKT